MSERDVDYSQAYASKIGHSNRDNLPCSERWCEKYKIYFPFFILATKLCSYVLLHETPLCIVEIEVTQPEMMKYNTILDIVCEYSL